MDPIERLRAVQKTRKNQTTFLNIVYYDLDQYKAAICSTVALFETELIAGSFQPIAEFIHENYFK
jgi:hypothetical protein